MKRAVAFVALLVGACGGASSAPPQPPPVASASASATAPAATSAPVASASAKPAALPQSDAREERTTDVRLLDAGAEPRATLRYTFTTKPESLRFDMKMTMTMRMGAVAPPPVGMPTVRMDVAIQPASVDAEGTLTANWVGTRVDVLSDGALPPAERQQLADQMRGIVGLRGRFVITTRGVVRESTADVPPTAPKIIAQTMDSLRDSFRNIAPLLPEEPMGVGARWVVVSHVRSKSMQMEQSTTYTLDKRDAKGTDETIVFDQTAPPQTMHLAGNQAPGSRVDLVSLTGHGTGRVHRGRDALATASTIHSESETKMMTVAGGKKQPLDLSMTLDMQTKPLP